MVRIKLNESITEKEKVIDYIYDEVLKGLGFSRDQFSIKSKTTPSGSFIYLDCDVTKDERNTLKEAFTDWRVHYVLEQTIKNPEEAYQEYLENKKEYLDNNYDELKGYYSYFENIVSSNKVKFKYNGKPYSVRFHLKSNLKSKGHKYEDELLENFEKNLYPDFYNFMESTLGIQGAADEITEVKALGSLNVRRPIDWAALGSKEKLQFLNPTRPLSEVGDDLADLRVYLKSKFGKLKKDYINISAKYGGTVSFINLGLRSKIIKDSNPKKYNDVPAWEVNLSAILKAIGVTKDQITEIMKNYYLYSDFRTRVTSKNPGKDMSSKRLKVKINIEDYNLNLDVLKDFFSRAIGENYILSHKRKNGKEDYLWVNSETNKKLVNNLELVEVNTPYVAGERGRGTLNFKFISDGAKFNFNFRSSDGKTTTPTGIYLGYAIDHSLFESRTRTAKTRLSESTKKTLVVSTGRFNPPTLGHKRLLDWVKKTADNKNADLLVLPTKKVDVNNPLDFSYKLDLLNELFPNIIFEDDPNVRNIFDLFKKYGTVDSKYNKVILILGSDRASSLTARLEKYNYRDYFFEYISSIKLDRNAEGDDVSNWSATKMRQAVKDRDFDTFYSGFPGNKQLAMEVFSYIGDKYL